MAGLDGCCCHTVGLVEIVGDPIYHPAALSPHFESLDLPKYAVGVAVVVANSHALYSFAHSLVRFSDRPHSFESPTITQSLINLPVNLFYFTYLISLHTPERTLITIIITVALP
jgi:hypothetical protein